MFRNVKTIDVSDWNKLVKSIYQKPYNFQQQDGCRGRGSFNFSIPFHHDENDDDDQHDEIPEEVNGEVRCVKLAKWLGRDPKQPIEDQNYDYELNLFWERNFYPSIYSIIDDLYERGILEKGEYSINISW